MKTSVLVGIFFIGLIVINERYFDIIKKSKPPSRRYFRKALWWQWVRSHGNDPLVPYMIVLLKIFYCIEEGLWFLHTIETIEKQLRRCDFFESNPIRFGWFKMNERAFCASEHHTLQKCIQKDKRFMLNLYSFFYQQFCEHLADDCKVDISAYF